MSCWGKNGHLLNLLNASGCRPNAGAGGAFGARPSLLDAGWMGDARSSDTVTSPRSVDRRPRTNQLSCLLALANGLTRLRYRSTTIRATTGIEAVPSRLFARSVRSGRVGIKLFSGACARARFPAFTARTGLFG
jgi:hypothetical protein